MSSNDIDKAYVSPYDKFYFTFDSEHSKSASQLKEIKKHKRIALLRDNAVVVVEEEIIWSEF
jgi:hypothetical protein